MIWRPSVTVAAIVVRDGRFLMVEELTEEGVRLNQPAGHLEPGESLIEASIREMLEETAFEFLPEYLLGIYRWHRPVTETTYLRFAFAGKIGQHHAQRALDEGIIRPVWLSPEEIDSSQDRHRSPLVRRCVQDYMRGRCYPLDLLVHFE